MTSSRVCGFRRLLTAIALALVGMPAAAQSARDLQPPTYPTAALHSQDRTLRLVPPGCWDEHPCLTFGDALVIGLTASFQVDRWRSDAAIPADEEILVRDIARRRVGLHLRLLDRVDVRVEREFADANEPWRDRYVNVRVYDVLQIKAGSFKLPFGHDAGVEVDGMPLALHTQSATLLAPGRDRGVMLHGNAAGERMGYEFGVFDQDGRNARTGVSGRVHGERTLAGRLTGRPWRPQPDGRGALHASVAFTTSAIPEGLPALNARTVLDATYYSSSVFVNGHQRRVGGELVWESHPCSASAEYLRLYDERLGESVEDSDLSPFQGVGWHVGGHCAVVGRRLTTGGPSRRTLIPDRGVGVVEVGARFERVRFGSAATGDEPATSQRADVIPGNGSRVVTVGVNWHLSRWVRLQFNAIRETLTDPAAGPVPSQPHIWNRLFRLQLVL